MFTWCNAVYTNLDILVAEIEGQLTGHLHRRSLANLTVV